MTRTFVAINDPVHSLLRNVTRHVPLLPHLSPGEPPVLEYRIRTDELPEEYFILAAYHSLKGMPLGSLMRSHPRVRTADRLSIAQRANFFDAAALDRRCARDLRSKFRKRGPGMLAGDLLAFGLGMLRACNDDPLEPIHHYLWSRHGRLLTRHEVVHARIRTLHWNSLPLLYRTQKESYDSTNVIYGDALGELEQLWDRRADTAFLDQVARSLERMRRHAEIAAFLDPPLNLDAVMKMHRRCQALWKTPPASARSLLRRVEFILEHTTVDDAPLTVLRGWESELEPDPDSVEDESTPWETDHSGYDGWLNRGGSDY